MPVLEYKLGEQIERKGLLWLVVRIVERDSALVVDDQNQTFISIETYVMLKCVNGEIDFEVLLSERMPVALSKETTVAPLPNLWRKNEQSKDTTPDGS